MQENGRYQCYIQHDVYIIFLMLLMLLLMFKQHLNAEVNILFSVW